MASLALFFIAGGVLLELICIIDAINDGTLVYRSAARQMTLPPARILHWAKRAFEGKYLRRYR